MSAAITKVREEGECQEVLVHRDLQDVTGGRGTRLASVLEIMATAIAPLAPAPGVEPAKRCKCGCEAAVAPSRVFVNRDHQVTWLRAEGAKRRGRHRNDAPSSAEAAQLAADPPVDVRTPAELPSPAAPVVATPFQTSHDMRPIEIAQLRPGLPRTDAPVERAEKVEVTSDVERPAIESPTDVPVETLTERDEPPLSLMGQLYTVGFIISALPAFCLTWLYCFAAYGTTGAALGWLPALVVSVVTGATWPGLAIAVLGVALTQVV